MGQKSKAGPAEHASKTDIDEHLGRILGRDTEQQRDDRRAPQEDAVVGRAGAEPDQHRQPEPPLLGKQIGKPRATCGRKRRQRKGLIADPVELADTGLGFRTRPLLISQRGDSGMTTAVRTARMIGRKPTAASPRQPTSGNR